MKNMYEINIIHSNGDKDCLGFIDEQHVTYSPKNEGLLVSAGRLHNSDLCQERFDFYAKKYRNKAELEFKSMTQVYRGTFCFVNFLPETQTAVFGSVGPVYKWCTVDDQPPTTDDSLPVVEQEASSQVTTI